MLNVLQFLNTYRSRYIPKIHAINASQRRWILLGLQTHVLYPAVKSDIYAVKNVYAFPSGVKILQRRGNRQCALVLLDAADLLGQNQSLIIGLLAAQKIGNLFCVGSVGLEIAKTLRLPHVDLLYNQEHANDSLIVKFRNISLIQRVKNGVLPGWAYLAKDFFLDPRGVIALKNMPEGTIVFAGQDGSFSLKALLLNHVVDEKSITTFLARLRQKLYSLENIDHAFPEFSFAQFVIDAVRQACSVIEATPIANLQFGLQRFRHEIIFRSIFRLAVLYWLRQFADVIILDFPSQYLRIYNSTAYSHLRYIDLGGVNGIEQLYPRSADMAIADIPSIRLPMPTSPLEHLDTEHIACELRAVVTAARLRKTGATDRRHE